ncbi:MAG: NUDIX hydrolase [Candidatus Izemoplasmatales bacterium]
MIIEIFADGLTKRDMPISPIREGSRAIIKKGNHYLLVHSPALDTYVFPGGGIEQGESKEEALKREILEETGYPVVKYKYKCSIHEYFIDSTWINHYFLVEVDFDHPQPRKLTAEEELTGMEEYYVSEDDILSFFDEVESTNIYGSEIHQREFLGFINSLE